MPFLMCPWPVYLTACVGLVLMMLQPAVANHGDNFLVAFPGSSQTPRNAALFLTPYNATKRVRLILATTNPYDTIRQSVIEPAEISAQIYDSSSLEYSIRILTNSSVVLLVFIFNQEGSTGAFVPSPIDQLSSRYIAITHCETNDCFLFIANPRENARVSVRLQLTPSYAGVTYNSKRYYNGDVLILLIGPLQSVQVNTGTVDLTGSVIESSLPVQVIIGGDLALSIVDPVSDALVEQMPTEDLLGTEFVLINCMSLNLAATFFKVVYTQKNTTLTLHPSNLTVIANNSYWISYDFKNTPAVSITSSKPVVVEMIFGTTTPARAVSVASVLVVPVSRWDSRYIAVLWTGRVTLVTNPACASNISLNQTLVTQWSQLSGQPEYSYTVVVILNSTRYQLQSKGGCTFWGYAIHQNVGTFAAYQIGWKRFVPEESSLWPVTPTQEPEPSTSPVSGTIYSTQELRMEMSPSSLVPLSSVVSSQGNMMFPTPSFLFTTNQAITTEYRTHTSSLVSSTLLSDYYLATALSYFSVTTTSSLGHSTATPETTTQTTGQLTSLDTHKHISDNPDLLPVMYECTYHDSAEIITLSSTLLHSTQSPILPVPSTCVISLTNSAVDTTAATSTLPTDDNTAATSTLPTDDTTAATSTLPIDDTPAATSTRPTGDNTAAATILSPEQFTRETSLTATVTTAPPVNRHVTRETLTNSQPNTRYTVTGINGTAQCQCACHCNKIYFSKLTSNSSQFLNIMKTLREDMQVKKETLTMNRMTKICLPNVHHKAKYVGGTFCLVAVTLVCLYLFASDLLTIICKMR